MTSLFLLIPIALLFLVGAICFFFWAVKSDQFEDLERHGSNILFDDEQTTPNTKTNTDQKK
ncbi:MAG: cbb3-type cytochrome oxidase assembly protein CcoS [Psychrobium sp.]|nr:cbb3-type cytochrome oxidase assembly protein CcoS [Psychrobium sp.]